MYNTDGMDGDKQQPQQNNEAAGWVYKPGDEVQDGLAPAESVQDSPAQPIPEGEVGWSASEYIAHEKGFGWYALLFLVAAVLAAVIYLLTKEIISPVVVLVLAATIGISGGRQPKVVDYRLSSSGITAGKKFYPFQDYKSFAIVEDGPFASVVLVPMKRLAFPFSAYLAPDSEHQVIEALANHLPLERGELDSVDRLMRQLRF